MSQLTNSSTYMILELSHFTLVCLINLEQTAGFIVTNVSYKSNMSDNQYHIQSSNIEEPHGPHYTCRPNCGIQLKNQYPKMNEPDDIVGRYWFHIIFVGNQYPCKDMVNPQGTMYVMIRNCSKLGKLQNFTLTWPTTLSDAIAVEMIIVKAPRIAAFIAYYSSFYSKLI